jgi:hypothetical protein
LGKEHVSSKVFAIVGPQWGVRPGFLGAIWAWLGTGAVVWLWFMEAVFLPLATPLPAGLVFGAGISGLFGVVTPCLAWVALSAVGGRLRVARDGLLLEWSGGRRYVPFEHVELVQPFDVEPEPEAGRALWRSRKDEGFRLQLRGGSLLRVRTARRSKAEPSKAHVVAEAVEHARRAFHAGSLPDVPTLAQVSGESARTWVERMISSGGRPDGYRHSSADPDVLREVVVAARAEPRTRVAAAIALRALDAEGWRDPVRVAATETASPELSKSLEAVLDDGSDGQELARALRRLERTRG